MSSIPCNYEINVARHEGTAWDNKPRYVHFCRIELGQISGPEATGKFSDIAQRFPAPQFECTLTYWECTGRNVASNIVGARK